MLPDQSQSIIKNSNSRMGAPNGGEGNVIIARGFRNGLRWKKSFFVSESPIPYFKIRGLDSMSFQVPFHLNLLQIL